MSSTSLAGCAERMCVCERAQWLRVVLVQVLLYKSTDNSVLKITTVQETSFHGCRRVFGVPTVPYGSSVGRHHQLGACRARELIAGAPSVPCHRRSLRNTTHPPHQGQCCMKCTTGMERAGRTSRESSCRFHRTG
jgi:hypothetical protein